MMKLYDSAFSPFARKVRMVLEHKGLGFQAVDGLLRSNHAPLKAVNGRIEVPALVDGDITVVNSADIVSYLEHRHPAKPVYPEAPAARVHARAWERAADTYIDAILVDISYWKWAERPDTMPTGLLDAARADFKLVYDALERELAQREFVSGPLSIADIALFPHLASAKAMDVEFSAEQHPSVRRWLRRMRELPIGLADLRRARDFVAGMKDRDTERRRIFWRGDRIEWLLARGYHEVRQRDPGAAGAVAGTGAAGTALTGWRGRSSARPGSTTPASPLDAAQFSPAIASPPLRSPSR